MKNDVNHTEERIARHRYYYFFNGLDNKTYHYTLVKTENSEPTFVFQLLRLYFIQ